MNGTKRTYNDNLVDERSREVFMLALSHAKKILNRDPEYPLNSEMLLALGAILDGAACGFKDDDDDGSYGGD
jgi:hypothetical protein